MPTHIALDPELLKRPVQLDPVRQARDLVGRLGGVLSESFGLIGKRPQAGAVAAGGRAE